MELLMLAEPTVASSSQKEWACTGLQPEKSTTLMARARRKAVDAFGFEGTSNAVAIPKPDSSPSQINRARFCRLKKHPIRVAKLSVDIRQAQQLRGHVIHRIETTMSSPAC